MKVKSVLLMFLIGLISYTGFAISHSDLRPNSKVDNLISLDADSLSISGITVGIDLQINNLAYDDVPIQMDDVIKKNHLQFNQGFFECYTITDVGKHRASQKCNYLDLIVRYKYGNDRIQNQCYKYTIQKDYNSWMKHLTRSPRDGLSLYF